MEKKRPEGEGPRECKAIMREREGKRVRINWERNQDEKEARKRDKPKRDEESFLKREG